MNEAHQTIRRRTATSHVAILSCVAGLLMLKGCGGLEDALTMGIRGSGDETLTIAPPENGSTGDPAGNSATEQANPEGAADSANGPGTESRVEAGLPPASSEASEQPNHNDPASATNEQTEMSALALINGFRSAGATCGDDVMPAVDPLRVSQLLVIAAENHSDDMFTNGFFDHIGSDGTSPSERIEQTGYRWRTTGENIAAGYPDLDAVMQAWMDSPGHCRNIMSANFHEVGVGLVLGDNNSRYDSYWTMTLASPLQDD
ncbi:MAG: CAP domain-containing protein [Burkholderiaceae bacterium]